MAGLPPPGLPPPGPSWRGPSGGDGDRSPWEPPPGLAVLGRALFRGGSRPQPALILGGPASARPARLSRAGPPAAAGARRQPPPGDGATMRRRRLCPSASSGPAAPGSSRRPRPRREGAEGAVGSGPSRVQRGGSGLPPPPLAAKWLPARLTPSHHGDPLLPLRRRPRGPESSAARGALYGGARRSWSAAAGAGPGGAMEGGGNSKGTGLGGLFGAGGVGYSHADLAGVPLTGMSPLSPYLNLDPRYLVQDTDEFILPTGANKTRGRFELAFFTIGGCCMTGAAFGALNGLRLGLKETQNMAWSKPRNVQILNMVTRQGALWANTLGSLALLYSAFGVIIEKTRGAEDDLNTIAAGTLTGMLYKSTGGVRGIARGGIAGLTLTGLYALYNNWEHMKGSIARQSL